MTTPSPLLLKVGELARHTGLTVRTLHHYDAIGLLAPTGRTESGYRLYSQEDVARLHGIQAMRQLGLPLAEIASMLEGDGGEPGAVLARQVAQLDEQIGQARELRERLALLRDGLLAGKQPGMQAWLDSLALMTTYTKYFSAEELRHILGNWKTVEPQWVPMMAEVRAAMDRGLKPDSPEVQPLVNRWMTLSLHWMEGDFDLMERWGEMYRHEPSAQGRNQAPAGDMIAFVEAGVELRMSLLSKYLEPGDLRALGRVPLQEWEALEAQVLALLEDGVAPSSPQALAAARTWHGLLDRLAGGNQWLRGKLARAWAAEPLLQAGSALSAPVRAFLAQAAQEKP
jgi:DNA-binding transcriptional MerR regulator